MSTLPPAEVPWNGHNMKLPQPASLHKLRFEPHQVREANQHSVLWCRGSPMFFMRFRGLIAESGDES